MARRKKESAAAPLKWEDVPEIPKEEQPYPLPEGWKWVQLREVIKLISGRDVPKSECNDNAQGIPYILGASNLKNNTFTVERWIQEPVVISKKGDLLISVKGTVGELYIQQEDVINISRQIMACRTSPSLYNKFLYFYLVSKNYDLQQYANGLIPGLSREFILNYLCPLPAPAHQQRIVTRIESLFSKLDEAAEKVQAVLDSHEARKQAILHQAFSGELTREWRKENGVDFESWEEKSLYDITNFIKAGGDKPEDFQENKDEHHFVPVVANGVENNGIIGYTSLSKHFENTLTIAGRGTIGFPFLRNYDYFPVVRLLVVSPKPSKILLKYLYYIFLAFPERGTGSSIPQLTIPKLKEKKIILCKIEEQKIIVNILDKVMDEEYSLLEMGKSILERIEYLKKSILEKAYRGNVK